MALFEELSHWFSFALQFNRDWSTVKMANAFEQVTIFGIVDYPIFCDSFWHLHKVALTNDFQWDSTAECTSAI